MRLECRFVFFSCSQTDLVISYTKIQLRKPPGSRQFVQNFLNNRDRVSTDDCHCIQMTVISAHAPGTVFLLDENDGRRKRTAASLYDPSLQQFQHLSLYLSFELRFMPVLKNIELLTGWAPCISGILWSHDRTGGNPTGSANKSSKSRKKFTISVGKSGQTTSTACCESVV